MLFVRPRSTFDVSREKVQATDVDMDLKCSHAKHLKQQIVANKAYLSASQQHLAHILGHRRDCALVPQFILQLRKHGYP